ncbi:unnamed protein product, partial [Closterium sp. NIES-53]
PAEPVDSGAARGADPAGAKTGGSESGGAETGGAESGGAETGCAEPGGQASEPLRQVTSPHTVDWLPMVERQQDRLVKAIRTDQGGEFLSKEFSLWLKKNGIRHSLTMPYSPAMNGIAKRANRTITETARGLLVEAGLPDYFWPDAVRSACVAKNRALTHMGADKWVPYVEWIGRKPKVDMLRVFGCMCMALMPNHLRHNKLGAKAIWAVHLGMAQNSKGWLLWDPFTKKFLVSRDCKFMENLMYKDWKAENEAKIGVRLGDVRSSGLEHVELPLELSSGSTTTRQSSLVNGGEKAKDAEEEEEEVQQVSERAPTLPSRTTSAPRIRVTPQQCQGLHVNAAEEKGRCKRRTQAPNRLTYDALGKPAKSVLARAALMVGEDEESDYEECAFAIFSPVEMPGEPATLKEALESSDTEEWKKAMESEMKSIEENGTWELVELTEGRKAITSKWLFKIKSNADGKIERYKSRLVAKGYQQKEKVDYMELFAPVVKPTTLRTLLAGAAIKGWVVKQMDVTTAFLNGVLEEEIFMAQPEGFDDGSGRVLRLKKALYGLKQAPRQWYLKLRGVLEEIGFTPSTADHSLFMLGEGEQRSFMVVYVDDILIFSPSSELVKEVMLKLQDKFKCKALGDVSFYLGLHIERDVEKRCMRVHQRKYLEALAANFGQSEGHVATPFPSGFKCVKGPEEESVGEEERRRFHSLVGSLMYAVDAEPGVAESEGADRGGAEPEGAEPRGSESGGAEPRGTESAGGPTGASSWREPLSSPQLRKWFARHTCLWSGAAGVGGPAARGTGAGGIGAAEPGGVGAGGACTEGTGAAGAGGAACARARDPGAGGAGAGGTRGAGAAGPGGAWSGGTGAAGAGGAAGTRGAGGAGGAKAAGPEGARTGGIGATEAGGAGPGGAGAVGTGVGDTVRPRPFFVPLLRQVLSLPSSTSLTPPLRYPPPDQSQPQLQPDSPPLAPSPYIEQPNSLTVGRAPKSRPASPVRTVRTGRRVPRPRPPPVPSTHSMALRPSSVPLRVPLPSPSASSLPDVPDPDLVDESDSVCPPSVGGESALGTDVLEDRQEEFECLAATVPHLVAMLLASEGDLDALDISTPRSYAEVITGFSQRQGVDFFHTFSPTPKMTTLRVWSLWRPVYGLRQAPREWHDTLRSTLAALGFAPLTADPSLFLHTDTLLPPFYILVYVNNLVFATTDTEALALVKSELQKRHTCTDLGELRSYLVLQRFGFRFSSPQSNPLPTGHSLSAPPSDESVEPSGSYPELVGCLMYLITCTRPDLAYPLSIVACYVAPGRHRPEHWEAAKRVLHYLCSTSGMGLVLGGQGPVVLTRHADASWVDDLATQHSSQGYTFSLGSGSVSWRFTRLTSVLSSSCEAKIYAGSMVARELRWLTYLLTDLGERPRSPPVLYVDSKAMIALCQEHRLEHRTKQIALRYFLARELQ